MPLLSSRLTSPTPLAAWTMKLPPVRMPLSVVSNVAVYWVGSPGDCVRSIDCHFGVRVNPGSVQVVQTCWTPATLPRTVADTVTTEPLAVTETFEMLGGAASAALPK